VHARNGKEWRAPARHECIAVLDRWRNVVGPWKVSVGSLSHPNAAGAEKNTGGSRTVDLYFGTKAAFAIGLETGQNSRVVDENRTSSRYAHACGLQRGRKLIENGNNLGQLAMAKPGSCMLVAGALKHVRGTGGPARILAFCDK